MFFYFIKCSCEKNNMSVNNVIIILYTLFNVFNVVLSKLMPKLKESTTFVFLLGMIQFSCPTHDML